MHSIVAFDGLPCFWEIQTVCHNVIFGSICFRSYLRCFMVYMKCFMAIKSLHWARSSARSSGGQLRCFMAIKSLHWARSSARSSGGQLRCFMAIKSLHWARSSARSSGGQLRCFMAIKSLHWARSSARSSGGQLRCFMAINSLAPGDIIKWNYRTLLTEGHMPVRCQSMNWTSVDLFSVGLVETISK